MKIVLIFFLIILAIVVISLSIYLPISIIRKKYIDFVSTHSLCLKHLNEINKKYHFKEIPNFDMCHSYDNESMYENICCLDYLTYQLVYQRKKVISAMEDTLDNNSLFMEYMKEVLATGDLGRWDTEKPLKNRKRLIKYEKKAFAQNTQFPTIQFTITVTLELTNINGYYMRSKENVFSPEEIEAVINKLSQRRGNFYLDKDVWQSICRVERGKVSNRMRFAIYKRDGYHCRNCGRYTNDLEIDHIVPISKGGKSTFDNLQTLCHSCNVKKGSNIE